jgi:hypothetical protein
LTGVILPCLSISSLGIKNAFDACLRILNVEVTYFEMRALGSGSRFYDDVTHHLDLYVLPQGRNLEIAYETG